MTDRPRLVVVAPYRVVPPAGGAALLVDGVNRALARRGWDVRLFSVGVGRTPGAGRFASATREAAPHYTVHHHASVGALLLNLGSRQATGVPPVGMERIVRWLHPAPLDRWVQTADLVESQGPFGFAALRARVPAATPMVLACHNVEGELARRTLAARPRVVARVVRQEAAAVGAADLVVALTDADADALEAAYGIGRDRIAVVPCGVDLDRFHPPSPQARAAAKARLDLTGRTVAVFTGARYGPNVDAVRHLERMAAGPLPDGLVFLVIGRVGEVTAPGPRMAVTGFVDDVGPYLAAADLAVVPMEQGGGMHLKMLEFMAAGLPVVATPFAARGLEHPLPDGVTLCPTAEIPDALAAWGADPDRRARLGAANREWVAGRYGWDRVAEARAARYRALLAGRSGTGDA